MNNDNNPVEIEITEKTGIKITSKKVFFAVSFIVCAAIATIVLIYLNSSYSSAMQNKENGELGKALLQFEKLGSYRDSREQVLSCNEALRKDQSKEQYDDALKMKENGDFQGAAALFERLGDYQDSKALASECREKMSYLSAEANFEDDYCKACELEEKGEFQEAAELFESLGDYKDSLDRASECRSEEVYRNGTVLLMKEDYSSAEEMFESLGDYKDSTECARFAGISEGDVITFGKFEQDTAPENGPESIEWIVLKKEGNRMLLLSRCVLDCQPFNKVYEPVTWETCTLRKWLNEDFLNTAFSEEELDRIALSTVTADESDFTLVDPGNDVIDRLFILSEKETLELFANDEERICEATKYAVSNGVTVAEPGSISWWWLRTPGRYEEYAEFVRCDGMLAYGGAGVSQRDNAVRPAMWLEFGT